MNDAEVELPHDVPLCHELIRQQAESLDNAQRRIEQLEHAMDVLLRCNQRLVSSGLDESLVLQQALVQIVAPAPAA